MFALFIKKKKPNKHSPALYLFSMPLFIALWLLVWLCFTLTWLDKSKTSQTQHTQVHLLFCLLLQLLLLSLLLILYRFDMLFFYFFITCLKFVSVKYSIVYRHLFLLSSDIFLFSFCCLMTCAVWHLTLIRVDLI